MENKPLTGRITAFTRLRHDKSEYTIYYRKEAVSSVIKITPDTYCIRIDGKDHLTNEVDVVEKHILGMAAPDKRRQNNSKVTPIDKNKKV